MRLKLIHKLLIALFASTAMVLLAMVMFTRISVDRGFEAFLAEQERASVEELVPLVAAWYAENDNWTGLSRNPEAFFAVLSGLEPGESARPREGGPRRSGPRGRPPPRDGPPPGPGSGPGSGRGDPLHPRVFLLDADQRVIVGRAPRGREVDTLLPVEFEGQAVGWLGLAPSRRVYAPEEEAFLQSQRRALIGGMIVALVIAALLAWLLARHLTRPVSKVANGIHSLAAGNYSTRVDTKGHDEIAHLGEDVNRLADALSEHQASRQRWMADIAHELRTPLAIINGELEAMADGVRPLNAETLGSVREEVAQFSSLVEDLRSLAQSDSGTLSYEIRPIELAAVVDSAVSLARPRLDEKGLELSWQPPSGPVGMQGDDQRLRQLVSNLLENARRYTDAPGKVEVSLVSQSDWAVLVVSDSAPGVSTEDCEKIFERLHRLEGSRNRGTGGSGLGLSICRSIVEAHGGTIAAEPGPLGGLRVTVNLPVSQVG